MPLSESQAGAVALFDTTIRDALRTDLGTADTATSGTLQLTSFCTFLSVTGTVAFTLPNGTIAGQRKRLECITAATSPVGTVTVTTPASGQASSWIFNTVGQAVEFVWDGSAWRVTRVVSAGRDTPTAATTLNQLVALHSPTITGTQDWILGNGSVPGQRQMIAIASAGSIPVGTISGLFYDEDGSADGVDINMDAAGDIAVVEWDGARWMPVFLVSATVS